MVTTKRPLPVQRFTAAHELGHAELGHEASLDDAGGAGAADFRLGHGSDPREDQANAFATELLTPQWLIVHHMKRQGGGGKASTTRHRLPARASDGVQLLRDAATPWPSAAASTGPPGTGCCRSSPRRSSSPSSSPMSRSTGTATCGSSPSATTGWCSTAAGPTSWCSSSWSTAGSGYVWQFGDLVDAGWPSWRTAAHSVGLAGLGVTRASRSARNGGS